MTHEPFQSCISACDACATACDHCAASCLSEQRVAEMAECIKTDIDCAAACRFASGAMARGSKRARMICGMCADLCDACAQECEKHDAQHCKDCAAACRSCARECRVMASS
ncbi:four-helix bundle copper-binding protein [Paraburkholderia rhynchosiae]|uniref:Four-helix bundle copper-binding protein n=1 Tax=Paraburkholderia rhynchosiae TaxID=487049 RepID=A0ABX4V7R9_9BURK|nr:four-helix bundle copper-binding protein [Paraburkholderia rhynchosiae]PMS29745.1 four-helix bundle copper-binding protein [Paraburkholderia rhynchosiae]